MAFAENASSKSVGIICQPSSLPDELPMDKWDSDGFFSTRKVCIVSDSTLTDKLLGFLLVFDDLAYACAHARHARHMVLLRIT